MGQAGQKVVVAEDPAQPFTPVEFGREVSREGKPDRGRTVGMRVCRAQFDARLTGDRAGHRQGVGAVEFGLVGQTPEVLQVEIVDGLGHQVFETLDQFDAGVGVAGHAQRFQDVAAELVDGGDGGGVESGQRVPEAFPAAHQLVGRNVDEVAQQFVLVIHRFGMVDGPHRVLQRRPDALA